MEKQTKISYLSFSLAILGSIIHNFFYGVTKIEEPVFFFVSILSFFVFLGSLIFNFFTYITKEKPKDIWKLGFLGFLGLIGIIPQFGVKFFGFFSFLFLLLLKKN